MSSQDDDGQQSLVLFVVFGLVALVIALVVGASVYQRGEVAATPKTALAATTTEMPANDVPNAAQNAMDAASVKVENGVVMFTLLPASQTSLRARMLRRQTSSRARKRVANW